MSQYNSMSDICKDIFTQDRIIFMYYLEGNHNPIKMGRVVFNYRVFNYYEYFMRLFLDELPWFSMKRNSGLLDKFFGAGNYKYIVSLPEAFPFKKLPNDDVLIDNLPNHLVCTDIFKYLDFGDQMDLSTTSKKFLRIVRSNFNICNMENSWFFSDKMHILKKLFNKLRNNKSISEYYLWWLCSCIVVVKELDDKWFIFLDNETTMMNCIDNNSFWYEENT